MTHPGNPRPKGLEGTLRGLDGPPASPAASGATSALTGYSILTAEDLADATDKAKGWPVLASGGTIEVYESVPVG